MKILAQITEYFPFREKMRTPYQKNSHMKQLLHLEVEQIKSKEIGH